MVSKQQMMSFIERTNNVLNSSKQSLSNLSISHSDTTSLIKKVAKASNKSISTLQSQSPKSAIVKPLNSTTHKESNHTEKILIKSSLEFIKNLTNTVKDLETFIDLKAKKISEFSSKESQALNKVKSIIEEHKNNIQSVSISFDIEKYEKSFMFFAKETAEELSFLEKKCKELEDDNFCMKNLIEDREKYEKVGKDIDSILGYLKDKVGNEDENIRKGLMIGKVGGNYGVCIKQICDKWAEEYKVESFSQVCKTLSKMAVVEHEAWSDARDEFASKITMLRNYKTELKDQILEKTLLNSD
ncbi:hypothetical protein SteCoe_19453 [Stentor coeruleus]|uniref:Uncharacterized protein n=1 Tax=Stentor coeruleus TaxID=5963 RepID=A0A1R2BU15_9CILI|nr:hypothetical protein SteCoe_19453 [Stentor coeruleus]